ncbi:MAG TPA: sugar kinase [Candidatus Gemmiger avium]|nr:sugar kinase [Candidatus Gemmiger avium]
MESRYETQRQNPGMILALGELLIDLIPGRDGMRMEDEGPVIKTASGSAGIFACAAALLGGNSGFIGKVGRDSLSRMATHTLHQQGVDISHLVQAEEGQLGLAFLEYLPDGRNYQYYRKNSVGSTLCAADLDEEYIASAFAIHFPGMLLELTSEMRSACQRAVEIARAHGVLVSFDPNIRRELTSNEEARERMLWAVRSADVVAPTLEEGRIVTGEQEIGAVLRALHAMGPRVVALTRDKDGAVLSRDGMVAFAPGIDQPPIDPTGAGDTLAAALCVGLRENMDLARLACFCNCAGTLAIQHKGAIGMALPTRVQVEELMDSGVCPVTTARLDELS